MDKIKYIKASDYKISERINLRKIIKNVFWGLFAVGVLLLLCSIIFTYTDFDAKYISIVAKVILYLGATSVGIFSSLKAKSNGWLMGGTSSAIYIVILAIIRLIFCPGKTIDASVLISLVGTIFFGVLGGILGINLKLKK